MKWNGFHYGQKLRTVANIAEELSEAPGGKIFITCKFPVSQ